MIFNIGSGPIQKPPVLDAAYPQNVTVNVGASATFKVVIAEDGKPAEYTYQWYYDGTAVSGETKSTYSRTAVKGSHTVYCMVTNKAGSVKSRTATVTAETLYMFKEGSGFSSGYTGFSNATATNSLITMTLKSSNDVGTSATSKQKVDVTNYKTATFRGVTASFSGSSGYNQVARLYVGSTYKALGSAISAESGTFVSNATVTIDISSLSGSVSVSGWFKTTRPSGCTGLIKIKEISFK